MPATPRLGGGVTPTALTHILYPSFLSSVSQACSRVSGRQNESGGIRRTAQVSLERWCCCASLQIGATVGKSEYRVQAAEALVAAMKSSAASSPEIVQMNLQASCNALPYVCNKTRACPQASGELIITDSASAELRLSRMFVMGGGVTEKVHFLLQLLEYPPAHCTTKVQDWTHSPVSSTQGAASMIWAGTSHGFFCLAAAQLPAG